MLLSGIDAALVLVESNGKRFEQALDHEFDRRIAS
jgi:hypothetical protein